MAILIDSSVIIAAADGADLNHAAAVEWLSKRDEPLLLGALSLAEIDHVLQRSLGTAATLAVVDSVVGGSIRLVTPTDSDLTRAARLMVDHDVHRPRLADALLVAAAERLDVHRIAAFDRRPLAVLRSAEAGWFDLEP